MIIDFHVDLLSHPTFSLKDPAVRCSPQQLVVGGITTQVCALYVAHYRDSPTFSQQNQLFFSLPDQEAHIQLITYEKPSLNTDSQNPKVSIIRSLENASGLGGDDQPLEELLNQLIMLSKQGPIAYLSPVWNMKNRFGGGCLEPGKLSADGKNLLNLMDELAIPVDLSHCSDKLIDDILDYTLDKLPNLKVLASHSNFRTVKNSPRNLLDIHAKEISSRGGIIGLNVVKKFVGESLQDLKKHLSYAESLGVLSSIVLGTDFFYSLDNEDKFFSECRSSEDHPKIHQIIKEYSKKHAQEILYMQGEKFLTQIVLSQVKQHNF